LVVVIMVNLDHVVHLVIDLIHVVAEQVRHQAARMMNLIIEVHLMVVLAILMPTFNLFQICHQYHHVVVHLLFLLDDLLGNFILRFFLFSQHRYSSKSTDKQRYFDNNIA
jgi:hypothetical protein